MRADDGGGTTRSFYASNVDAFLDISGNQIVGQLATRVGLEHAGNEAEQIRAWQKQIAILKSVLADVGEQAVDFHSELTR